MEIRHLSNRIRADTGREAYPESEEEETGNERPTRNPFQGKEQDTGEDFSAMEPNGEQIAARSDHFAEVAVNNLKQGQYA